MSKPTQPAEHLLIETQGGWAGPGCERFLRDAVTLAQSGHRVCLLLVQDGVQTGLAGASHELARLVEAGCEVWVDGFSMAARALPVAELLPSARVVDMSTVAGKLLEPDVRVVWR